MTTAAADPVALCAALIREPSVTPDAGTALDLLAAHLTEAGFACTRVDRGGVPNLFARKGETGPVFGFNGHVDVVPVGDAAAWTRPPFSGHRQDGVLWGRGAQDMKSGVAAFAAAAIDFGRAMPAEGSIILLITGDEEGPALHGTVALLDWMAERGIAMDHCLVGEPTCPNRMGEMMKIGRRGSMNARFAAKGVQGHVAYPHRAKNPLPALIALLDRLCGWRLDEGTEHFDPSSLQVTTIDVGNPATNVIPAEAHAAINIRFNDAHCSADLIARLDAARAEAEAFHGLEITMETTVSGESFITEPGLLSALIADAAEAETGVRPEPSTTGGTSDARFIAPLCPVVEFGLVGDAMHQVDENVPEAQIAQLKAIYLRILEGYFSR